MKFRYWSRSLRRVAMTGCVAMLVGCGSGEDAGAAAPLPPPPSSGSGQVFALLDPGESATSMSQFAQLSTVDGLAFRARWRDMEPVQGSYDWSQLDAAISAATGQNKRYTVHVGASGGAWPAWLTGAGAQTYSFTFAAATVIDPVPWDAVYLAKFGSFVDALATHIRDRGALAALRAVSVGVPIAEMSVVGCRNGLLGGALVYDRSQYLSAWRSTVAKFAAAFPDNTVLVSAPVSVICMPDNDGGQFLTDVLSPVPGGAAHLAVFAADLNALGSARMAQVPVSLRTQFPMHFQTIWSANPDPQNRMQGTLREAVCQGLALGGRYFEIYKSDLLDTSAAAQAAVSQARSGMVCQSP